MVTKRPAGAAFARYGSTVDVEKFGNTLIGIDDEIEQLRAENEWLCALADEANRLLADGAPYGEVAACLAKMYNSPGK